VQNAEEEVPLGKRISRPPKKLENYITPFTPLTAGGSIPKI
jgi:hypothetical protein